MVPSEIHSLEGSDDGSSSYLDDGYGPTIALSLNFLAGSLSPVPENPIIKEWFAQRDAQTDFVSAGLVQMADACTSPVVDYVAPSFSSSATKIIATFADASVSTIHASIIEADEEKEKMAAEILELKT